MTGISTKAKFGFARIAVIRLNETWLVGHRSV